jgi:hypothetical protein
MNKNKFKLNIDNIFIKIFGLRQYNIDKSIININNSLITNVIDDINPKSLFLLTLMMYKKLKYIIHKIISSDMPNRIFNIDSFNKYYNLHEYLKRKMLGENNLNSIQSNNHNHNHSHNIFNIFNIFNINFFINIPLLNYNLELIDDYYIEKYESMSQIIQHYNSYNINIK